METNLFDSRLRYFIFAWWVFLALTFVFFAMTLFVSVFFAVAAGFFRCALPGKDVRISQEKKPFRWNDWITIAIFVSGYLFLSKGGVLDALNEAVEDKSNLPWLIAFLALIYIRTILSDVNFFRSVPRKAIDSYYFG